ncbi:MAG: TIGR03668 family PPOX class F420-dependent oxidoreductase [Streptosporangiaceae bacterium]
MRMPAAEARRRFAAARVARLATVTPDGAPHIVPVTFVLDSSPGPGDGQRDQVYTAVDAKPKSTTRLQRLRNIRANPRVALLADCYADDWTRLWWVRADGQAAVLAGPDELAGPLRLLAVRYPQYAAQRPAGPVIAVRVDRWTGWAAAAAPGQRPPPPAGGAGRRAGPATSAAP